VTKLCNTAPEPKTSLIPDGFADIDRFTRFMRRQKLRARQQLAETPLAQEKALNFSTRLDAPPATYTLTKYGGGRRRRSTGGMFTIPRRSRAKRPFILSGNFLLP